MNSNDDVRVPLFLVHDDAVDAASCSALVRCVGSTAPVSTLSMQAIDTRRFSIEGMATDLLAAVLRQRPHGPFRVAGMGRSGVLAYEMAVQLVGRDESVEFVGLIDAPFPAWPDGSPGGGIDLAPATSAARLARAIANYAIQPMPLPLHLFGGPATTPPQPASGLPSNAAPSGWESLVPRVRRWHVAPDADPASEVGRWLSQALRESASTRVAPLPERQHGAHVVIQSGRRGEAPVLCVPGAGDSVIGFIPMSEALGSEFPLHGLQPRGVEGLLAPHTTVEAAAAFYLDATAALRHAGPVHLVGHSFGGWIVFEMASRLRAMGKPVASLTVIDSEHPDGVGVLGGEYTSSAVLIELMRVMELSAGKSLGIDIDAFMRTGRAQQLGALHEGMVRIGLLPRRSDVSAVRGVTRTFATALRTTYRPAQPYAGPLNLALARDPAEGEAQSVHSHASMLAGWRRWAPDVKVWNAPGDHFSILRRPHVQALARWWHANLARHAPVPETELTRAD